MNKQFWNLWSTYALTYFGKVNLSIVMAALSFMAMATVAITYFGHFRNKGVNIG